MASEDKRSLLLIQVLRGIAAVMVVVHHSSTTVGESGGTLHTWLSGAAGVDIFFVISGFVMLLSAQGLARRSSPATEFMKRRVERIVPLYWIFTTLKIGLTLAAPTAGARPLGGGWHVAGSYLFWPGVPVVAVGWTLSFEMFFYVLFALALAVKARPLRMLIPTLILISMVPFLVPVRVGAWKWCDPIVLEFLFGMLLFESFRRRLLLSPMASWIAAAGGFSAIFLIAGGEGQLFLRPWVWGVPALMIVAAALGLESQLGQKVPRWMLEVGDASYSIYLSHTFVLHGAGLLCKHYGLLTPNTQIPLLAVMVIASVIAGAVVYRFIERPIIHYFRDRRQGAVPARA